MRRINAAAAHLLSVLLIYVSTAIGAPGGLVLHVVAPVWQWRQ